MNFKKEFYNGLKEEFESFTAAQNSLYPEPETIKIDLHCHDKNSDIPDEVLGRMLGVPETWLEPEELVERLNANGCAAVTVTNHNNARSCYELRDKGFDVLTGAEFSCSVPDYSIGLHVLAYGFTPAQETVLNELRYDIYRFLEYACEQDVPTVWAHPLYHYRMKNSPGMDFFAKMSLLFERFEVINGQRDTRQNMLVGKWVESLTPDVIEKYAQKFGIPAGRYCRRPYKKSMAGGSDSHMGIFAGLSGSRLYVPQLKEKRKIMSDSMIALEAIKAGEIAPYGSMNDSEKMTVTFLDYFCQIAMNMKDPGLIRMLLHSGGTDKKILAFFMANAFSELSKHKVTMTFLNIFHESFSGKLPGLSRRLMVTKDYKPVFDEAVKMAISARKDPQKKAESFHASIDSIYTSLNRLLIGRIFSKLSAHGKPDDFSNADLNEFIESFEIPAGLRDLFSEDSSRKRPRGFRLMDFLDGLSFPFLASAVILGASFTSANVLYKSRKLLNEFAENLGSLKYPERMLWLTDTFEDNNGVATVLKSMLDEIRSRKLPIDILVCSNILESAENLIVVKPLAEYENRFYEQQPIRVPDALEIYRIFREGEYDRLICSTEGPMGLMSLFLKYAYTVPAYFYLHTDWLMFIRENFKPDTRSMDRVRRMLRAFYRSFDGVFVLNTDQQKWLTGSGMGLKKESVMLTAHWVDPVFRPHTSVKKNLNSSGGPVMLYAGRVSAEKGVMDLPYIFSVVKETNPEVRLIIAGTGPAEQRLREALPEAEFAGWVNHSDLPALYSSADILLMPSNFDTFGCVVLESLSCGTPVAAYSSMGPKDIIEHGKCGFLARNKKELAKFTAAYLGNPSQRKVFRNNALRRSSEYSPETIIEKFMADAGLNKKNSRKAQKKIRQTA